MEARTCIHHSVWCPAYCHKKRSVSVPIRSVHCFADNLPILRWGFCGGSAMHAMQTDQNKSGQDPGPSPQSAQCLFWGDGELTASRKLTSIPCECCCICGRKGIRLYMEYSIHLYRSQYFTVRASADVSC